MARLNALDWIAIVLTVIGGLNWGLVGLFEYNLVADLFGPLSVFTRTIYTFVALSSLYILFALPAKYTSAYREHRMA